MRKLVKPLLVASLCVCALIAFAACAGTSQASSSGKSSQMMVTTDDLSTEPFYVMLIGSDSRYDTAEDPSVKEGDPSYSDVNMLMRVDPQTFRISLLSIARDTEVDYNGQKHKINDTHFVGGPEGLVTAVTNLTGVHPEYYAELAFKTYTEYVDELGGVTANVPFDMRVSEPISNGVVELHAGDNQQLKGTDALGLGRQRKEYRDDGEACRQIKNREIVMALIQKVASQDPSTAASYAEIFEKYANTNLSADTLAAYVKLFQENHDKITFQLGTGPYQGSEFSELGWAVPQDQDTYRRLIDAMNNGGNLEEIVPLPVVAKIEG